MVKIITWVRSHSYKWHRREYLRVSNISILLFLPLAATLVAMVQLGYKDAALIFWGLIVANGAIAFVIRWVDEHEKKLAK